MFVVMVIAVMIVIMAMIKVKMVVMVIAVMIVIIITRSCAALRAADLDWIVEPEYSLGGYIFGDFQLLRRRSLR